MRTPPHASKASTLPQYGNHMTSQPLLINSPGGSIQGLHQPDGSAEYLGIRYATAERFRAPVDHETWSGIVQADTYGHMSPQVPGTLETLLGFSGDDMSEDCHFLNVYTPPDCAPDSGLPVLFWIHGGAYLNGAGSLTWYHGARLAARGSIVVTINYRLGALGFLGDGNYGLLDMISALRWTHRNISSFGGNQNNVTIFGESAGGSAVLSLMASSDATPFFFKGMEHESLHRATSQC